MLYWFRREREKKIGFVGADLEYEQFQWCAEKTGKSVNEVKNVINKWIFEEPNQYLFRCIYPGVVKFFNDLRNRNIKIGIYSDYDATIKLQYLNLNADLIISSTDKRVNSFKPLPNGLLLVIEELGIKDKERCLYIGDRLELDGKCAENSGVQFRLLDEKSASSDFYPKLSEMLDSRNRKNPMVEKLKTNNGSIFKEEEAKLPQSAKLMEYISVARPDNWVKNVFMVPGMLFSLSVFHTSFTSTLLIKIFFGLISFCLVASANYVINEYLDKGFDKFHPLKKDRSSVVTVVNPVILYMEYAVLACIGLTLSYIISIKFLLMAVFLLFMGVIYNVKPFRSKDRVFLDVLSESINNPIRFAAGWFIFAPSLGTPNSKWDLNWINTFPPVSIIIAYWMGGAFLMATKRFAEYRLIGNSNIAGQYRRSFKYYSENTLLVSMFFYGITSAFFLGIFLIKDRIELLVSFPFFALLFSWYLRIGLLNDSPVQGSEKLYTRKWFMLYLILFTILLCTLMFVEIPWLHWFLKNANNY